VPQGGAAAPPAQAPTPPAAGRPSVVEVASIPIAPQVARPRREPGAQIKVGMLLSLSGRAAAIGRDMQDAAQMALFDNADAKFELLMRDDGGTVEGAREAASQVLAEGAQILLGPLTRAQVQAVAPLARQRGVAVVSFSNDRGVAGDGVLILGYTPEEQIERVVRHAAAAGVRAFGALAPDGAFGQAVALAMDRNVIRAGGQLVRRQGYAADSEGDALKPAVDRALSAGPSGRPYDALLIAEGGARLRAIAQHVAAHRLEQGAVRFLGTRDWQQIACREPALAGAWFPAAPPQVLETFQRRFATLYRRQPDPLVATLAYDAVALAAVIARDPAGADFSLEHLADPDGFAGTAGIFRFGVDGVAQRGLAILEVQRSGCRVVSPAPETFQSLGN